ncbi:NADH dehydrogenase [ubiquinone] 1 beta subcomplex subunit 9 [Fusarium oxysporum f. sp. albedinis]|nr:NADH dehydrogenase [ubiquinone] 1 beta subcomplex subunit 9 [Fusarium oxysporum f. sp. albedinis]
MAPDYIASSIANHKNTSTPGPDHRASLSSDYGNSTLPPAKWGKIINSTKVDFGIERGFYKARQQSTPIHETHRRMLSVDSIVSWLNQISNDEQPSAVTPSSNYAIKPQRQKRRLPTPSSENNYEMDIPQVTKHTKVMRISGTSGPHLRLLPKRDREDDDQDMDNDNGGSPPTASKSGTRFRSRSPRKRSSPSRASVASSSPSRKLDSLSLNANGCESRQLGMGDERHPKALRDILKRVNRASRWKGILNSSLRDEFSDLAEYGLDEDDGFSDQGSALPRSFVAEIMEHARKCHEKHHSEIVWNFEVHFRLLEKIFRVGEQPHLVDFTPCQSAPFTRTYLPPSAGSKLVDFCIYLNPLADSAEYETKANSLRTSLPMLCLNHTSYLGLKAEPISISIETKRSGDTEDNEVLQMGTWQAAQWNYLRDLLSQLGGEAHMQEALDELGLLPAIITNGHVWSFVATTQEYSKTVSVSAVFIQILWAKFGFGDTSSLAGVYAIATVMQYLRHWTETVYWEWFKKNIRHEIIQELRRVILVDLLLVISLETIFALSNKPANGRLYHPLAIKKSAGSSITLSLFR